MNQNIFQISARHLGELALLNFCPKCFWLKLKLNFKLPFQIFPGIFSSIDSYSKKITWTYYQKYKKVPPWFNEFGNFIKPVKAPSYNNFYFIDENTNIKLTGVADEIFLKSDNSYFIADYKISRFTNTQDELLPLYEVQLNSYALIAKNSGFSPVSGIGLVYYEPMTEVSDDSLEKLIIDEGLEMEF